MKKILFNPVSREAELTVPAPRPSKEYAPEWFRSMKPFSGGSLKFDDNGVPNKTAKLCSPFNDSFSLGYIQETWQDIYIEYQLQENGSKALRYHYPTGPDILQIRGNYPVITSDNTFVQADFVWHPQWIPQLPSGWSAIITHPFNRHDLPFYTMTGVVESDSFTQSDEKSNLPFLLKEGFTGLIKKGTPMYQIIPVLREDWTSSVNKYDEDAQLRQSRRLRQHFWGGYKKYFWVKKNYNE